MDEDDDLDAVTDAALLASRVLVAVAAQSLADVSDDLTLPQYRALVVLESQGPQLMADLAAALDVNPSTASRLCDRLVRKRLVRRVPSPASRREVEVSISTSGSKVVESVTRRRRRAIGRILRAVPHEQRAGMVESLRAFGAAAGEVPEQAWSLGWSK